MKKSVLSGAVVVLQKQRIKEEYLLGNCSYFFIKKHVAGTH